VQGSNVVASDEAIASKPNELSNGNKGTYRTADRRYSLSLIAGNFLSAFQAIATARTC